MKLVPLTILFLLAPTIAHATPSTWNLPQTINDENTKVEFSVDSTWHLVEGKTSGISGRIWLDKASDPLSVRADLTLPVANFNTDGRRRDDKMRQVMHANQFPKVGFRLLETVSAAPCKPEILSINESCHMTLKGEVSISGHSRTITLPVIAKRAADGFEIVGDTTLQWAEYGIEDPSILIAKLKPSVSIKFAVHLADNAAN